jgi:prepilin-type processing-associated H-X9-DG protein
VEILAGGEGWLHEEDNWSEYSQFGEDGLIAKVLDRVGTENRYCFEVGAGDGMWLSNTRRLRASGWKALLVEIDGDLVAELMNKALPGDYCVHADVMERGMDAWLSEWKAPQDLDLGVIDIDGFDWHVWDRMVEYRPRVMLVECNAGPTDPPPPQVTDSCELADQAGRTAITQLGMNKGYEPVAMTYCNVLFVDGSLL